jgi:hypothetical protein
MLLDRPINLNIINKYNIKKFNLKIKLKHFFHKKNNSIYKIF